MREYECEYPLEVLDDYHYPNLRRDRSGKVISENISWFRLREINTPDPAVKGKIDKMLVEM